MRAKRLGQRLKVQQLPVKAQHRIAGWQRLVGLHIGNRAYCALYGGQQRGWNFFVGLIGLGLKVP